MAPRNFVVTVNNASRFLSGKQFEWTYDVIYEYMRLIKKIINVPL